MTLQIGETSLRAGVVEVGWWGAELVFDNSEVRRFAFEALAAQGWKISALPMTLPRYYREPPV
jgi:hypothetical protein